jgi:hypothetical protein
MPLGMSVPAAIRIAVPGKRKLTNANDSPNDTRKIIASVHLEYSLMKPTMS